MPTATNGNVQSDGFRVLIAGGGPVGLALGVMLQRKGIDFLILERSPQVIVDSGACILVWPHATRLFHSMGLLEALEGRFLQTHNKVTMHLDGKVTADDFVFDWLEENHGYPAMNFPRKQLVSVLHEAIEHTETHIRTSADVVGIETTENSVQVQLSDGSTEKGSILIGADGAWSRTRELMNELIATGAASASQNQKQRSCGSGEQPEAIFQCLYGSGRPPPSVEKRVFYEGHGNGLSTQFAVDDMGMHFALFKKMDKTRLDRRFTADETDAYRKEFANIKATPDLCWADVFEYVDWSRLVVQPEGETKQWFHGGRIVLVGDSAIQMTSNAGMGYNDSLQSAVFLVNSLCGLLREEAVPSEQSLTRIFAEYQKERQPQSSTAKMMSAWIARGNTWTSWSTKLFVEFVIPHVIGGKRYITMAGKSVVSKGRTLDGVSKEWKTGKIPWAY